jgi:hypothetical protein
MSISEHQYNSNLTNNEKLDEIFKAATDTIQNLPKNGKILSFVFILIKIIHYKGTFQPSN